MHFFFDPSVEYFGHQISKDGISPTKGKVHAILNMPSPQSVTELKSYLGLLNYYSKFLPNLSSVFVLTTIQKNNQWTWGTVQEDAIQASKRMLDSKKLLVHYDAKKEVIFGCDASPYGTGAVLSHQLANGVEKPIAFASRSLISTEKKYSQIDKEALALIFGVETFHKYLFGHPFVLKTDHRPLTYILGES